LGNRFPEGDEVENSVERVFNRIGLIDLVARDERRRERLCRSLRRRANISVRSVAYMEILAPMYLVSGSVRDPFARELHEQLDNDRRWEVGLG